MSDINSIYDKLEFRHIVLEAYESSAIAPDSSNTFNHNNKKGVIC
jgi:hypothetical protein